MQKSRFIVGLLLVAVAVVLLVFGADGYATAGAIAMGVLGITLIAISRRRSGE